MFSVKPVAILFVVNAAIAFGQATLTPATDQDVAEITKLSAAGFSSDRVIQQIRSERNAFLLSAAQRNSVAAVGPPAPQPVAAASLQPTNPAGQVALKLVVIPKGSLATGTVTDANHEKSMGRARTLDVNICSVHLAEGEKAALKLRRVVKQVATWGL